MSGACGGSGLDFRSGGWLRSGKGTSYGYEILPRFDRSTRSYHFVCGALYDGYGLFELLPCGREESGELQGGRTDSHRPTSTENGLSMR